MLMDFGLGLLQYLGVPRSVGEYSARNLLWGCVHCSYKN